jgi:ankyrin repeat protein
MVELLISKGADVNAEDNDGYTPLYWAAMQDSKGLVELLTAKGATPVSTIHLAASAGDLAKVKSFIEEGTDVNAKDKFGRTPLYRVLRVDTNDLAEFLIAKGADVNAKDNEGVTPLHLGCLSLENIPAQHRS